MAKTTTSRPTEAGGDNARPDTAPRPAYAVTAHHPFFKTRPGGGELFAVQAGIPLNEAFDELNLLLQAVEGVATDLAICIDDDGSPAGAWGVEKLMPFARALAASMHSGLMQAEAARHAAGEEV